MNGILKDLIKGFKNLNLTGIAFICFMLFLLSAYLIGSYETYANSKIFECIWHLIGVILPLYVIYQVLMSASKY